ncbi:MAG: 2-C-methyl-D-erythritol 2,4-cyclodiphosphate synthase [Proteobacteria bacterium]|nr:2-C-methyl-D-erythritol 2,4-cyclodiphosphate synthase [Pseudomonadota bacterium]MCL2308474.1 2-C-methyl-D-erythritol 2,4-cyclodiphosphate synthase [Pseudomonadota bacterium]
MMRIGHGFDVHAFADNRRLRLGGIDIPFERGLAGHSDADVVLHAITDALLGALALGDIGHFFPDSDARYKDADSRALLRHVVDEIETRGYRVGNIDVTVIAERPKLAPYRDAMRQAIAEDLRCDVECVSVKATTTEKLGFTGREEGIAAQAVVLLSGIRD